MNLVVIPIIFFPLSYFRSRVDCSAGHITELTGMSHA